MWLLDVWIIRYIFAKLSLFADAEQRSTNVLNLGRGMSSDDDWPPPKPLPPPHKEYRLIVIYLSRYSGFRYIYTFRPGKGVRECCIPYRNTGIPILVYYIHTCVLYSYLCTISISVYYLHKQFCLIVTHLLLFGFW